MYRTKCLLTKVEKDREGSDKKIVKYLSSLFSGSVRLMVTFSLSSSESFNNFRVLCAFLRDVREHWPHFESPKPRTRSLRSFGITLAYIRTFTTLIFPIVTREGSTALIPIANGLRARDG